MSARILVLGGGGFIGGAVMRELAASDWATPVAASRRKSAGLQLDANDPVQLGRALADCDGVVNCVAGSNETLQANAGALSAALRAAAPALPVVHLSSMAVYGAATGLVTEAAPLVGDLGPYSVAKIEAEQQLLAARPDAVILRPGIVYGGGSPQWTQRIATLLRQRRLGDLGPLGDGCCNLVHVTDVARAVASGLRLGAGRGGCFNLSLRAPPTWNEYFVRFATQLRYVPVRRLGARRMKIETKLLAPPFKILEILAGRLRIRSRALPPPIPGSLLRVCAQELRLDTQAAEQVLGLAWLDLGAGLREAAAPYFLSSVGVAPT